MYTTLKAEIARSGIRQKELAEMANMTETTLSLKINGKRDFKYGEMRRIRRAVAPKMTIDELFFIDRENENSK